MTQVCHRVNSKALPPCSHRGRRQSAEHLASHGLSCFLQAEVEARPLLYNNFMTFTADETPVYNVVPGYEQLRKTLNDKLAEYNESNAVMDLVLFQQAMEHICRITRIISLPRGNAMLVGVGGSGKQSLARCSTIQPVSECCNHCHGVA